MSEREQALEDIGRRLLFVVKATFSKTFRGASIEALVKDAEALLPEPKDAKP